MAAISAVLLVVVSVTNFAMESVHLNRLIMNIYYM